MRRRTCQRFGFAPGLDVRTQSTKQGAVLNADRPKTSDEVRLPNGATPRQVIDVFVRQFFAEIPSVRCADESRPLSPTTTPTPARTWSRKGSTPTTQHVDVGCALDVITERQRGISPEGGMHDDYFTRTDAVDA